MWILVQHGSTCYQRFRTAYLINSKGSRCPLKSSLNFLAIRCSETSVPNQIMLLNNQKGEYLDYTAAKPDIFRLSFINSAFEWHRYALHTLPSQNSGEEKDASKFFTIRTRTKHGYEVRWRQSMIKNNFWHSQNAQVRAQVVFPHYRRLLLVIGSTIITHKIHSATEQYYAADFETDPRLIPSTPIFTTHLANHLVSYFLNQVDTFQNIPSSVSTHSLPPPPSLLCPICHFDCILLPY
jgi:hypothetical protein